MNNALIKLARCICAGFIFTAFISVTALAAPYVYYEKVETETILKDVTYTVYKQATTEGLRDIYVLTVPLNDPNITLLNAGSTMEYGLKETAKQILTDNNAIAGVNGDFFGLKGTYSASFGPVVNENSLESLNSYVNSEQNEYASFFVDTDNNPFIQYLRSEIRFSNNAGKELVIQSKNKITDMVFPNYLDRVAMTNTKSLDERFPNLYKIVVSNNVITYISGKGENVEIPSDGYIITMSETSAAYNLSNFSVGQAVSLNIRAGVDFNKIQTAIGGGGRILLDDQIVSDSQIVAKGHQPRTAIGIRGDKSSIVLVVVDGRTHSIGATHEDMAILMRRFGCSNAMHLDGGGSSSMVIGNTLVNTPSEGAERKVINALGVVDKSEIGPIQSIKISTSSQKVFKNTPVQVKVVGYDEYLHKIEIPQEQVLISTTDKEGYWKGEYFYPSVTGNINFTAAYENMIVETAITSVILSSLESSRSLINVEVGDRVTPDFLGISAEGERIYIYSSGINYEVWPADLGRVEYGTFIPERNGLGYLKCSVGDINYYIDLSIGHVLRVVTSFEQKPGATFMAYPSNVTGNFSYSSENVAEANLSVAMNYTFTNLTDANQAAYYVFDPAITFVKNPISLKAMVYGNNSGHWLRAKFIDADGVPVLVDLARNIDWTGYKEVEGKLPANVKYPVSLERIYVAALPGYDVGSFTLYLDYISATFPQEGEKPQHPASTLYSDPWKADMSSITTENTYELSVSSNLSLAVGTNAPLILYNSEYSASVYKDTIIITVSGAKGGILSTSPGQWQYLLRDLALPQANVIILTDKKPSGYTYSQEYKLLHNILAESNKNIFVISSDNTGSVQETVDGVRYINLNSADISSMLKLRLGGNSPQYSIKE